jgi:hypothetical protein
VKSTIPHSLERIPVKGDRLFFTAIDSHATGGVHSTTMLNCDYLLWMLKGYLITIAIETTVLVALLSRRHSLGVRLFAGVWLTACTYPVVWLVLPPLFDGDQQWLYLLVAETFAPVAECAIFWYAFIRTLPPNRLATWRDLAVITFANLCSFGIGEVLIAFGLFGPQ